MTEPTSPVPRPRLPLRRTAPPVLLAVLLAAASCGAPRGSDQEGAEATPHGYVEGAEETAEAQWTLVLADAGTGTVHLFDPATEESEEVGTADGVQSAASDGRFAYLAGADGTTVVDTGTWTVDHGDHVHYYRAPAALVGTAEGGGPVRATGDTAATALAGGDGSRVLDRSALEEGEVTETGASGAGLRVPFSGGTVAAGGDGVLRFLTRAGEPAAELDAPCTEPSAAAVTRRGAVLACEEGAVVLDEAEKSGEAPSVVSETGYPDGFGPPESLEHRPGAPVLAAVDGDGAVGVFDVAESSWEVLDTGPAAAASAAGEDLPVLVLGSDGTLRAFDPASGEETASTELPEPPAEDSPGVPSIQIDTARAYVNAPAGDADGGSVTEIDYQDDLRTARTFDLPFSPDHLVETGW